MGKKKKIGSIDAKSPVENTTEKEKIGDAHNENDRIGIDMAFLKAALPTSKCLVKTIVGQKWYEFCSSTEDISHQNQLDDQNSGASSLNSYWLEKIEQHTQKLYLKEMEIFVNINSEKTVSSEKAWINMVLKSGTLPDKMSAYSVLLQEDPVHNLPSLESLVNMISLKSRRPCMLALDALRDLFCNHLLPKDRKLKTFPTGQKECLLQLIKSSSSNAEELQRQLILMSFENKLKVIFARFLEALDAISKDTVDQTKLKAMKTIFDLLVANPEQEAANLARLVNKLGDTTRGIAAKAGYQLNKLLEAHPVMKNIVLGEVERLLYRPNVSKRAQYYGICCLSQLMLNGYEDDSAEVATKLIGIYFSFFKLFAVKKGDLDSKLISALLTGVNRAYPYLKTQGREEKVSSSSLSSHVETMYRVVHMTTNFGTALQALTLLFQLSGGAKNPLVPNETQESFVITSSERFYSTLYKKMLDISGLSNSSAKQALFLNLLYKAMKSDEETNRSVAFVRRLLQSCSYLPSHLVCSMLYLLSELFRNRPDIKQAFTNILRKPEASLALSNTNLLNTDEVISVKGKEEESSSDEEYYRDVKSEDEDETSGNKTKISDTSSWVFKDISLSKKKLGKKEASKRFGYNPEHRNPLYALGMEGSQKFEAFHDSTQCSWELSELSYQFHPSVQLFVQHLLDEKGPSPITYGGDPLSDFTLIRFLDRFVFRNPKKDPGKGKPSSVFGKRNVYRPTGIKNLAVDGKEYAGIADSSKIPADERFIHTYFRRYSIGRVNKVDDHPTVDDDNASVNSDDFDAAIQESSLKDDIDFASALDLDDDTSEDEAVVQNKEPSDDDSDDDAEVVDSGSDFEVDDFDNLSDDMAMSSDEDLELKPHKNENRKNGQIVPQKIPKSNVSQLGKRKAASYDLSELMASAEDYEQLIEEDSSNVIDSVAGSINDVFNKDKSSIKQMKWEEKRRNGDSKKAKNSQSSKFNKMRPNNRNRGKISKRKQ